MEEIAGLDTGVRINKFLSEAGVCSRREADRMLGEGRICIDGIPAKAGTKVMPGQHVTVDGVAVSKEEEEIYIAFYNQKGWFVQKPVKKMAVR